MVSTAAQVPRLARVGARRVWRAIAALALLAGAPLAQADSAGGPVAVDPGAGTTSPVLRWKIQSIAKAQQGGAAISAPGFTADGWYSVSGRATVMAGLLENGVYKDVFYSDNLRTVQDPDASGTPFMVPWWYRTEFTLAKAPPGTRTLLRLNGMIPGADVWLNGQRVADRSVVAGAYPVHVLDVTPWVREGDNALALEVPPADPRTSLSIGWVDWNPEPPDHNMGPWRGVDVLRKGPVELQDPRVSAVPALPDLARAALSVTVTVRNLDGQAHDAIVSGTFAGVSVRRTLHLAGGQMQDISFSPSTDPALALRNPRIWWPLGMGEHPLYQLRLVATVDGAVSDVAGTSFGVRSVTSHVTAQGGMQFVVNGQPVLIRGAGWTPDMFLRHDDARMETEFAYIVNLGLNTIRSEGKLEDARFYELADREGIMVLAGWECCDKWESAAGTGGEPWDAADEKVAAASMASEARLLRNHPSVIGFMIGSDHAPPPAISKMYVDTLRAEDWPLPIISSATPEATAEAGPSGMKMEGPYSWVPPAYWYADRLGGAFGFDSEVSAGASIPPLEDLRRMLTPQELDALWKDPQARQYHASAAWSVFATLAPFDIALARRYGEPRSLEDYVAKAQLDNYDNARAQFEAFNAHRNAANPATGVIYWMLNNAWPSLHWHLYDYYLNPAGAYFGARVANEPVHIQYSYDTRAIMLVNQTLTAVHGLRAAVRVRNFDGSVAFERRLAGAEVEGNTVRQLMVLPALEGLSRVYFIELELSRPDGQPVGRNVYWLSTQADELDWAQSNWYLTPVTRYADLTPLQSLPTASCEVQATVRREADSDIARVTLSVPASSKTVALFQHVSVRQSAGGDAVLPVRWSDNDVTLWPGESIVLTARFAHTAASPLVEVSGWNVPSRSVPAVVERPAAR